MNRDTAKHRHLPTGPGPRGLLIACVLAIATVGAACTSDDSAATTTTQVPTTTSTTPPTPATPEQDTAEEPPEPEWVVQIGGAEADALLGVASRDDEVVASGYTESALAADAAADRDILIAVVGTDAEVHSLDQVDGRGADSASGVASGGENTVSCGITGGAATAVDTDVEDVWCASVSAQGELGLPHHQGGPESDILTDTAMTEDGSFGYAGGYTLGLFPGASDTSAGVLGEGDALLWQINPDGTPRWIRQFGTQTADRAQGVAATSDGDGLVVGHTDGSMDGPSKGGPDGFIARYDTDGLPRWTRQFGTEGADRPIDIAVGGEPARGTETLVTVGSTDGALAPALGGEHSSLQDVPRADGGEPAQSNAGGTDAMVYAADSAGNELWSAQLGVEGDDEAVGVAVDGTTVLVVGTTSGTLGTDGDPSAGGTDGFLAALTLETGTLRWITQFGSNGSDVVTGVTTTEDGLIVVSGQTAGQMGDQPNAGGLDGFLIAFPLPSAGGSVASAL